MTNTIQRGVASISLGVFVAATATTAIAQTTTTTDHPKAIGTSQQTADEAQRKAVQSGKDAAFVRTGPSAADKASDAATTVKNKTGDAVATVKEKTGDAATTVKDKTSDAVTTTKDKTTDTATTTKDKAVHKTHKAVTKTDKETTNP